MALTFSGGIYIPDHKKTAGSPIINMPSPERVAIPMSQHIGIPAQPIVKAGDYVKIGQLIGQAADGLSCPVHASISGTVEGIEQRNSYIGAGKTEYIVIKNDNTDTVSDELTPYPKSIEDLTAQEIIEVIRQAGISGMGGATFPTYQKIASSLGKAENIIINCAECEPYITANHRLMLEDPDAVIDGAQILLEAFGLSHAVIAIEDNKPDAADVLSDHINHDRFDIVMLKSKYPQGDERQIIYALTKIEVPAGKLPSDVGYVVFNTETCAAVYYAFSIGMPLCSRIVTVSGDCVAEPKNIRVPIGTSFKDVFDFCGGFLREPTLILSGGPMMGTAIWDMNSVVTKGTCAILAFCEKAGKRQEPECIHCGKCVKSCPMRLMPNYLALFSSSGELKKCEEYNVSSCVECGCCAYICPGKIPIVQHIRTAKEKILTERKRKSGV